MIKKMYYSIGEVSELTGLEQHMLRYWEAEVPQLRPKKNSAGNRAYREKDIEVIRKIKHLLHEEKLSIPGVKQRLAEERKAEKLGAAPARQGQEPPEEPVQAELDLTPEVSGDKPLPLADIRRGLEEVLALLTPA